MEKKIKIALDVMGSDHGSRNPIAAAIQLVTEFDDVEVVLVGKEPEIQTELQKLLKSKPKPLNIAIHHAPDVVQMADSALQALRLSQSSMAQAVGLIKNGQCEGVLSSGSTAAYLACCYKMLGLIPGIKRPAFMPIMPTLIADQPVVLLDVGANVENSVEELINFAIMADIYQKAILKNHNPKIGLVNIATEPKKGPIITQQTYEKLTKLTQDNEKLSFLNFTGYIEPRDVLSGKVDIVICDGYTGNVVLKAVEGMATIILTLLKQQFQKNLWRKLLALLSINVFKGIRSTFNYKNVGGAQLIGINGICFKAHGSSDQQSYYSTLKLLRIAIKQAVTTKIKSQLNLISQIEE